MIHQTISRRTMLRGAGVAVSLPLLEAMSPSIATAATAKKTTTRLCYLYFPNGVANGAWQPEEVADDGSLVKLNEWMSPLEPLKSKLIIPKNVWTPRGNGHAAGTATWLTGHGYNGRRLDAGGESADQIAARAIGGETLLPSLEMSTRGEGYFSNSLPRNTLSWANGNRPVPRETEPRVIFDRMFRVGNGGLSDRSVLDSIRDDAKSLRHRISQDDHHKLDEYLESIRAVEKRIEFADKQARLAAANPQLTNSLTRPDAGIPNDHGEYLRTMFDMIVLAYWADATRVSTFMLDHGQSNRYFNFIDGVQGTWHALSHWKDASGKTEDDDGVTSWNSPEEKRKQYNAVTRWHHEQVAYFLSRLEAIQESNGGTLLDNSMVVYGSSLADGHEHAERNLPLIVAGGGGGTIKMGRQLRYRRPTSMSKLHLSMLNRLDPKIESFGEAESDMTELDT